ncbi:MAG: amidohydrolase family protein [Bacteroidales bacterium]|nr:amidohydrolase family protein [Bacteroidales bacterium]
MKLHDAHIHVGQFRDLYSTPQSVLDFLANVGVDKLAVSSSSTCCGDSSLIISEMQEVVKLGGDRVVPVLWIYNDWISDNSIESVMNCGVEWKCLKVHGYMQNWHTDPTLIGKVVSMARERHLPILFHTGGRDESDAGRYLEVVKNNPDITFILAHSRPVEQAIELLKACPNAWADTAFTPFEEVLQMISEGFEDRMMWGTDYPLHHVFYAGMDINKMYHDMVNQLQNAVSPEVFDKLTYLNFERLFKL